MSSSSKDDLCERGSLVAAYVLGTLQPSETKLMEAHVPSCAVCQEEYQALRPVAGVLSAWRANTLPPSTPMWKRLAERIVSKSEREVVTSPASEASITRGWPEPPWQDVAPGITCKLLSSDVDMDRVSMLVRLSPGTSYPPHTHASVEELYLLEGELWIDDRQLCPGDYNRADPGTSDQRVWSSTGCMCLLITSPSDAIR